jgi:hypothetical protein
VGIKLINLANMLRAAQSVKQILATVLRAMPFKM